MTTSNAAGAENNVPGLELHLTAKPGIKVSEVLNDYPDLRDELFARLDPRRTGGSLVLISGGAGNGTTMTAMAVLEDLASRIASSDNPLAVAHVGILEYLFSPAILARTDMNETCLLGDGVTEPVIFYDDIYQTSGKMAFEAMAMVMAGRKVIGIVHGESSQDGVDQLRKILDKFGVGASFLTDLISSGRVFSVYQSLRCADDPVDVVTDDSA